MKKTICLGLFCMLAIVLSSCSSVRNILSYQDLEGRYIVERINSDANPCKSETQYIYGNRSCISLYSLEEQSEDILIQFKNAQIDDVQNYIRDYAIQEDWIYYVKENILTRELIKLNYKTGDEEVVFEDERLYGVGVYNNFLFYYFTPSKVYMCPINKDPYTDSIELNAMVENTGISGQEKSFSFNGITVGGSVYPEENYFNIDYVREEKTNNKILYGVDHSILFNGNKIIFSKESQHESNFLYRKDGDDKGKIIDCLENPKYKYSDIYEEYLTEENGLIIGLVSVSQDRRVSTNLYQDILKNDLLFQLNPETGENKILYQTKNNRTRIIGYQDGIMYLLNDYRIYSQPINGGEKKQLFSIPENIYYTFDWQAGYLIVLSDNQVITAYKVE